ncbi:MAG TPA: serine hydrolase domain-containing protein [Gaiellaceae bacterium]|nr:serine hydrolase domain-containing protein [Gaiellaceae bacterium]
MTETVLEQIEREGREYAAARKELTLIVGLTRNGTRDVRAFRSPDARYAPLPDEETLYEIGSVSKVYTTALLSVLVSRGVLALDDTIASFFPDLELKPEIAEITVFDLATHSSGLDGNGKVLARLVDEAVASGDFANYTYYERYGKEHLEEEIREAELARPRGSGWEYSRTGLSMLGHILEVAAGEPYEILLKRHICEPLGLKDTTYTLTEEQDRRLVRGYYEDGTPSNVWLWGIMLPQGGIRSTMDDMLTFAEANLADDDSQLTADLRRARETEFEWPDGYALPGTDVSPPRFRQALGWRNTTLPAGTVSEHAGATFSYQAVLGVHQESRSALVALTSSATNLEDLMTFPGFCLRLLDRAIESAG